MGTTMRERQDDYYAPLTYIVPPEDDGVLLRTILRRRLNLSRRLVARLKQTERGITVNGERRLANSKVAAGDLVEVRMETELSEDILPQEMLLDILYEDKDLLVLNKPAGIVVHPTKGYYTGTLANGVMYHWQQRGERFRFRPVHRLDQDTSGVLCVAKNPFVHQHIAEQMKANQVEKEYLAIVHGRVETQSGTVEAPIDRNPEAPAYRIVTPAGYPAVTHYRVVKRLKGATLLGIMLETGRTHQIRVHMAYLGHPLLGDSMYGDAEADRRLWSAGNGGQAGLVEGKMDGQWEPIRRQALHASRLSLVHPVTKQRMTFHAPLPDDFARALSWLGQP